MGTTIALTVLEHIPSLSFFQLAKGCDLLLLRDDFYYRHHFYHNRTRIVTKWGPKWIEVGVVVPQLNTPINQIKTSGNWKVAYRKHIARAYSNHPFYAQQMPLINKVLDLQSVKLGDYNYYFMKQIAKWLQLPFQVKRITGTPDVDIADRGFPLNWVLSYYNGSRVKLNLRDVRYVKLSPEIELESVTPTEVCYSQMGHATFIPNVSIMDALMNLGSKQTRKLIVK